MRRALLWLGLVLTLPLLGGGIVPGSDSVDEGSAGCTVTLKARRDVGTMAGTRVYLNLTTTGGSRVRIRRGTWSGLGTRGDPFHVVFNPDGTWYLSTPNGGRKGSSAWSGQVHLKMGCNYNRRYEFEIQQWEGSTLMAEVRPQYPSTSSWTKSQVLDLGNLARYF